MYTSNKNIVLSGGSRGLGQYFVERFLETGNNIGTFARSATSFTDEMALKYPDNFFFDEVNVVDSKDLSKFLNIFIAKYGAPDTLINNAAIGQDDLFLHAASEKLNNIIDVNIKGTLELTRLVTKRMFLLKRPCSVINISSICGARGYTGLTAYSATKGAIDALTRTLARELSGREIYINSVAPGFFESEMSSVLLPEQLDTIKRRTPTGRMSTEGDVFKVVDLLASASVNIHGQIIYVDGGASI